MDINLYSSPIRNSTIVDYRRNSTMIYSTLINKNKSETIPTLIQLFTHPDENYAYRTMRKLITSNNLNLLNECDGYGRNILMYSFYYQRYRLLEYLLNETALDIDFQIQDKQGNTILHYAILYSGNDNRIVDQLIEKYNKFAFNIDERNNQGFTPLLLAAFCGRYDLVLNLLAKTNASPFVRDYIHFKNIFDYIEIDCKNRELINLSNNSFNRQSSSWNSEEKRTCLHFHQVNSSRSEISFQMLQNYTNKDFIGTTLTRAIHDQSGSLRLSIVKMYDMGNSSMNLNHLLNYLNRRYPRVKILKQSEYLQLDTIPTKFTFQRENSKAYVHDILNLFDPNLRTKVRAPQILLTPSSKTVVSTTKTPTKFKQLGTKIKVVSAFSRAKGDKKKRPINIAN